MNNALEWVKKHPKAAAVGVIAAIIVVVLILRRGGSTSSSSGIDNALASSQAGQLQMAQLNAQLSAQQSQTDAQLAAQEYSGNLAAQEQQNQLAGQIIATVIPQQIQGNIYSQALKNQAAYQTALAKYIPQAFAVTGQSNRGVIGEDELALLLGAGSGSSSLVQAAGSLPQSAGPSGGGAFGLTIPGVGTLGVSGIG